MILAGCSSDGPVTTTPPKNPIMSMSPQQQIDSLEANTTMPPAMKARKIEVLKRMMGQKTDSPVGRKIGN